jgi:hypothetical protein
VQTCCRLGIDFIEITLEVRVIILDACMQVDVRKERVENSKNRSSESREFYRFSSVCTKTAVRMCNESKTEDQRKASSIRAFFNVSCAVLYFPGQLA